MRIARPPSRHRLAGALAGLRGTPRTAFAGVLAALLSAALALPLAGCARGGGPERESRDALGTVVSVAAYGEDAEAVRDAIGSAYEAMEAVEGSLDAYDASSAVAAFNRDPYRPQPLPADARDVLGAVEGLDAGEWFSPSLLGVVRLYDFEGGGRVPEPGALTTAVRIANSFGPASLPPYSPEELPGMGLYRFRGPRGRPQPHVPGLDFGGAAKGLALDRAAARMREGGVGAALLTAGSSTVAFGAKPDGEPWRVGVEDPRDPERVVATIVSPRGIVVSTSGDYQRFFVRDGVRYHHILDPRTGRPARGLRSLTVLGELSGLDSDILSTALFVAGRERAEEYARDRGLGLVTVDDAGRVRVVRPRGKAVRIETAVD